MPFDQLIYNTARADGMPATLAELIAAQARHETGDYSHRFFTTGKNAFGYSYVAGARWQLPEPGTRADNGLPIAQYRSVADSVHELTDWIKRRQREGRFPANLATITDAGQYARLLKDSGYYGASLASYAAGLQSALQRLGPLAAGGAGLLILAGVLWLVLRK